MQEFYNWALTGLSALLGFLLHAIAVNPPETQVTDWPVEPDEVWSN